MVDGNTHYYLVLEGEDRIFDVALSEFVNIILYDVGDEVTLRYREGEPTCTVYGLDGETAEDTANLPESTEPAETVTEEEAADAV